MLYDGLRKRHTVRPTSSGTSPKPNEPSVAKGPYGSWCTPPSSPIHTAKPPTDFIELESRDEIDDKHIKPRLPFMPQKVRLSSSPSSDFPFIDEDDEVNYIEVDIQKEEVLDSGIEQCYTPDPEKSPPPIEIPQSPVPAVPKYKKKWRGFHVPAWCDPFLPIDPHGRAYITWLFLMTFTYSYNTWCIALRATFPYQTPKNTPYWMAMDYFCDIFYLMDVAFVKPRLIFLSEGFWVNDPEETRKNYMKKLQFKFDVISLLPLDLLYLYFGTHMVILRFPRMLKLQTFWEFHRAMDRVLSSPYVVRIGKMLFYIFYLIHLNACAYYAMSDYIGLGSNEWVYDNKGNAYIRCFYFATKTATSIGKNPKPENTIEYLFMTAAWLMGVFVFAVLIGQIRDIIATATRARTEYRKTVDGCTQYLRRLNMPGPLQKRVTSWFNYTWTQQRCFDESRILDVLPYNMKRDVALAVHMTTLSKVQLFRDCSDSLLRDLVLQLRPVSFLPGDEVVRRGEVGHDMYFIKSGECWVMSPDEKEILATLKEGSVFGEISLLGIEGLRRRTATVRSRGYSTLFCLSRSDLDSALKHHKEAARILRLRADQIIRENAARQAAQRMARHEPGEPSTSACDPSLPPSLRHRRPSSASGNSSAFDTKRRRSASASVHSQTKKRLSVVSENIIEQMPHSARPSLTSAYSGIRTPIPKIVFSKYSD